MTNYFNYEVKNKTKTYGFSLDPITSMLDIRTNLTNLNEALCTDFHK